MPSVADVEDWAERYRRAWETRDAEAAGLLFSENSRYRSNIFEDPHQMRAGVEDYWREVTSVQSDVRVRMGTPLVEGNRAMVEFWTTTLILGDPLTLAGSLILEFDATGLCTSLHEYWQTLDELRPPYDGWGG